MEEIYRLTCEEIERLKTLLATEPLGTRAWGQQLDYFRRSLPALLAEIEAGRAGAERVRDPMAAAALRETVFNQIEAILIRHDVDMKMRMAANQLRENLVSYVLAALRQAAQPAGRVDAEPSFWWPETDPVRLKVLGKLGEELAEGGAAVARCIIQGIDEVEPTTGKINRHWLEDEIADIEANIEHAKKTFRLDRDRITARTGRKFEYIARWIKHTTPPTAGAVEDGENGDG